MRILAKALIIPDVHQDLGFLASILEREAIWRYDRVVFLGDYFDAKQMVYAGEAGTRGTARLIREVKMAYPDKVTLLWGNHDMPYFQLRDSVMGPGSSSLLNAARDDDIGTTIRRARWIHEEWPKEFWGGLRLLIEVDGWLLSHAGIHPDLWRLDLEPRDALEDFLLEWETVEENPGAHHAHPLLGAGRPRGGDAAVGGPLWLDWEAEFTDELPYAQIVGHSRGKFPRQRNRSWCIDCGQTVYATLRDGLLAVRDPKGRKLAEARPCAQF